MGTSRPRFGRRPKLTRRVQGRIVEALKAGNYTTVAVGYAGIGRTTFYRWMHRGQQAQEGLYREFYEAVRRALAVAEVRAVAILRQHMPKDWRAAMGWLERRYSCRWGIAHRQGPIIDPRKVLGELLGLSEQELLEAELGVA